MTVRLLKFSQPNETQNSMTEKVREQTAWTAVKARDVVLAGLRLVVFYLLNPF